MANEENLNPFRTESEAREKGKNGGKASGVARRRKKELRELCSELLEMSMHNDKLDKIKVLDDATKHANVTVKEALLLTQIKKAIAGDTKAFEAVYKIMSESGKGTVGGRRIRIYEGQTLAQSMKMSGKFAKLKTHKQLVLKSKEYSHVMHEINTYYDKMPTECAILGKYIGDYYYIFDNYGFNHYNIFMKVFIGENRELLERYERRLKNGNNSA